jgi:phosphatidylglycerol---prolipoprotein diacylglyceryl transferase
MMAPLIPYIQVPEIVLIPQGFYKGFPPVPFSLKPFGILVAIGVYLGSYLTIRQGKRLGLNERAITSYIVWLVGSGFVGGHVFDVLFYYPGRLLEDPLSLVRLWDGLSSFGGFLGGTIGMLIWRRRYRAKLLPYADVAASAFPAAWVFGRMGCSVAHDHPGIPSEFWLAVQYPGGARFDLGFLEMLLTIPLAIAFLLLRRRPRAWGFYIATMAMAYAPVRFALDFLRVRGPSHGELGAVDPRYGPFTPAQWACFALLGFGVYLFVRIHSPKAQSIATDSEPLAKAPNSEAPSPDA